MVQWGLAICSSRPVYHSSSTAPSSPVRTASSPPAALLSSGSRSIPLHSSIDWARTAPATALNINCSHHISTSHSTDGTTISACRALFPLINVDVTAHKPSRYKSPLCTDCASVFSYPPFFIIFNKTILMNIQTYTTKSKKQYVKSNISNKYFCWNRKMVEYSYTHAAIKKQV